MNRLYVRAFRSQRHICSAKRLSEALRDISIVRNYSTSSAQGKITRIYGRRELRTFRADKLCSVGQPIVDLSHSQQPTLRIPDKTLPKSFYGQEPVIHLYFSTKKYKKPFEMFPAGTRGVLYFHHVPGDNMQSQIRFRLCDSLDKFSSGQDLHRRDGSLWKLTLKAMARALDPYGPTLALLQQEFSIESRDLNSSHHCHRVITTLDPQKLPSSDQVVSDISGLFSARFGKNTADSTIILFYKSQRRDKELTMLRYPPDTIGVFYYKQSLTAPSQLGELRFRLCHHVQEFAQGTDLCFPSGEPWCVSSLSLYTGKVYQVLQKFLAKEGLLAASLLPGALKPLLPFTVMPLRALGDPFVVDLSSGQIHVSIMNNTLTTASMATLRLPFRKRSAPTKPLFNGRAIVRLEEYPHFPPSDAPGGPLVAMRFLEMLTPIQRLSDDDHISLPQVGELLLHRQRKTKKYVPWGYGPNLNRKMWVDWIARSRAQTEEDNTINNK